MLACSWLSRALTTKALVSICQVERRRYGTEYRKAITLVEYKNLPPVFSKNSHTFQAFFSIHIFFTSPGTFKNTVLIVWEYNNNDGISSLTFFSSGRYGAQNLHYWNIQNFLGGKPSTKIYNASPKRYFTLYTIYYTLYPIQSDNQR